MNFLFPVLSAVLQAGSFTLDKIVLSIRRVDFKTYTGVSFPLSFLVMLAIFLIIRPPLSFDIFAGSLLWPLLLSVVIAAFGNVIFFRALDSDKLGEIQTLDLLRNIPIIIIASLVFTDERNVSVIIPALVAALAVVWSHWEHHHFRLAKRTWPFVLWGLATAPVSAAVSKTLLLYWNPISLGLVQTGMIALLLRPLFAVQARTIPRKAFTLLIITNLLTSISWILFYFSYQYSGIVYTTLVFSLQPLLVYLASIFFLKETFQWKKAVAFFVVLVSIGVAQLVG